MNTNDIEVKEPQILGEMNQEEIDLTKLSNEQRKEMLRKLKEDERKEKELARKNKETLQTLTEEVVDNNVDFFVNAQGSVEEAIIKLFTEAETIIEARGETFGIEKTEQDSHTMTKKDGSASIKIGWNVKPTFDGTESAGIQKIKQYMSSLAGETENEKLLMDFLNIALKTDVQGNYNPKKIRELNTMRERANSDLFNEGMDIIDSALIDIRTSMYARGYKLVAKENEIPKRVEFSFSIK
ncbi:hypothetical protein [Flavobacterium suncheonense]|uniref:DUF3164 family protein n=1 Tax=Flavobacterium suncheonense GH29-5 = DSM 17707 TaxID=1121899 RepID=A0A0A2MAS8_9FLAO|nr:hypothetical protein [Flavobacterium suncheonense]KGO89762.1 hypothetical protein Q764_06125 [Flavobacterium suncheonense GH29-5 = DSM 17707]